MSQQIVSRRLDMRKTHMVIVVTLACLLSAVPMSPAAAETGTLKLTVEGQSSGVPTVRAGSTRKFWGRMLDSAQNTRCKYAKVGELSITSDALSPSPDLETTTPSVFSEHYAIRPNLGTREVKAVCRGWTFTGHVIVITPRALAGTGVPVLPTAGLGLALTAVGWLLVLGARSGRTHPIGSGRSSR
jgi:hypothetical protein